MKKVYFILLVILAMSISTSVNAQYQQWYYPEIHGSLKKIDLKQWPKGWDHSIDSLRGEMENVYDFCMINPYIIKGKDFWFWETSYQSIIKIDTTGKVYARKYKVITNYMSSSLVGQKLIRIVIDMSENTGRRAVVVWTKEKFEFFEYSFDTLISRDPKQTHFFENLLFDRILEDVPLQEGIMLVNP